MKKQTIRLGQGFIIPSRVVAEDEDTLTLQVPKNDSFEFKLDKDDKKNQFLTVVFIRQVNGNAGAWKPWEGE